MSCLAVCCMLFFTAKQHVDCEPEALEMLRSPVNGMMQVFKHKPKKHYQRKTGHRQPLTKFLVTKIAPDS